MQDPEFLQSVLENLPGVDPTNEAIRNAMGSLASQTGNKPEGKKDEEKKKWAKKKTKDTDWLGKYEQLQNYLKTRKGCWCIVWLIRVIQLFC